MSAHQSKVPGPLALWRWLWLFDHLPGWAVLAGGTWLLVTIGTIGLSAAAVTHSCDEDGTCR
jgi:hypothetical protein